MPALRNIAIIAHVDHGKTTLVDGLLKQAGTFRENEAAMSQELIMDSNDQERERGITILAKTTAVTYKDTRITIIDTPGHADFGGEVERTLGMAEGVVLVVDAQEGPMPQTKFVLRKALGLGLKVILVINKIDKKASRIPEVLSKTHDLFLDLATDMDQLEFPVIYAIGREGKAWAELPADPTEEATLEPLFEAILKYIPAPSIAEGSLQMMVSNLEADAYQGKLVVGRISRGSIKSGQTISLMGEDGTVQAKVERVYVTQGLKRTEVESASSGEVVILSGVKAAKIGDTIAENGAAAEALPRIKVEEPTLSMQFGANTSPLAGREGKYVTSRQILDRITRELETNVSMKFSHGEQGEYILAGRGELHLAVFIETLRREGYELEVGKPQVVTREIDGHEHEPLEELIVTVPQDYVGAVTGEIGRRRGLLLQQSELSDGSSELLFNITTRGLIGLRSTMLTLSRGTATMNSTFMRWEPKGLPIPKIRNGALIASEGGKTTTHGLENAQARGILFVHPGTEVYEGMIVGLNGRDDDLEVNVCREKKLTNVRSNAEISDGFTPATILSLEQSLDFLEDDELLEVTPISLRLRKMILNLNERQKTKRRG
jgi:GTP-binding protein